MLGYIINGGIMRNSSGGAMLRNSVVSSFAEKRYRFISHTEKLLAKFAVEKVSIQCKLCSGSFAMLISVNFIYFSVIIIIIYK